MPYYHPIFLHGDRIRILSGDIFDQLLITYKALPRRLPPNPVEYYNSICNVASVSFENGGYVLYSVEGIPGLWPEDAIIDHMLEDPDWSGYPRTSDYYSIDVRTYDGLSYVVVSDRSDAKCLMKYSANPHDLAANIKLVAARRHFAGFHRRYELECVQSEQLTVDGRLRVPQ